MKSKKGKKIFAYRGIPYAKPPLGSLRFKRSEPFGSWEGTLDGTKEAKKSFQPNVLSPKSPFRQGGEDCLYLNVYTKQMRQANDGQTLPVVVYFHGGAFVVGSCESMLYGPQVLLDRDIVLVGVNYRLGPFGWMSLESEEAPGNLGLHDQYLALLWVQENIEAFGGRITRASIDLNMNTLYNKIQNAFILLIVWPYTPLAPHAVCDPTELLFTLGMSGRNCVSI